MLTKAFYDLRTIGCAFPFTGNVDSRFHTTQSMKQKRILGQCYDKNGGGNRLMLESIWRTLAIPALVELSEGIDDICFKPHSRGETLRDFTVRSKTRFD